MVWFGVVRRAVVKCGAVGLLDRTTGCGLRLRSLRGLGWRGVRGVGLPCELQAWAGVGFEARLGSPVSGGSAARVPYVVCGEVERRSVTGRPPEVCTCDGKRGLPVRIGGGVECVEQGGERGGSGNGQFRVRE